MIENNNKENVDKINLGSFDKAFEDAREIFNKQLFTETNNAILHLEELANKSKEPTDILKIAELLNNFGYLSEAEKYCNKVIELASYPSGESVILKKLSLYLLADIAAQAGSHDLAHKIISRLVEIFPEFQDVWSFLIFHMNYDPSQELKQLKEKTEKCAQAIFVPKEKPHRPKPEPLNKRPLRLGYVSGDFKYHPVGFLIRDILPTHDPKRVQVFAYDTAKPDDNIILKIIERNSTLKNVSDLDDDQFEALIRKDKIDVLVDLSGFTAGNRLTVFAREPAPVLVSWLGYWSTTGLKCIDAVILDKWHAPEWMDEYFTEKIVRMPVVRFCYQPFSEEPVVNYELPCIRNGYVTFASFNNTIKINSQLLDCWSEILHKAPDAHLLLKWKTFNDSIVKNRILKSFVKRGIEAERINFSTFSPIPQMLEEYYNVDIALDTFPFTGGITTLNALWMGIPVVTLEGKSVIGRQGYAVLSQLGLEELSAKNCDHYINIATGLANNVKLMQLLRLTLRNYMRNSPLLDVKNFTKHLENIFYFIYEKKLKEFKK